jgi:hypothetical protein
MLKIIRRFGKDCSLHLQGKYVMAGLFFLEAFLRLAEEEEELELVVPIGKNGNCNSVETSDNFHHSTQPNLESQNSCLCS